MMYSQFAKDVAKRIMDGKYVTVLVNGVKIEVLKTLSDLESFNKCNTLTNPVIKLGEKILPKPYNAYLTHMIVGSSVEFKFKDARDAEDFYYAVTHTIEGV